MLGALLLALFSENPVIAPALEPMPMAEDVQTALLNNWVQISSSGLILHDYAVRNLNCVPARLRVPPDDDQKLQIANALADKAVSQVRCTYEFATLPSKNPGLRTRTFPAKPKIFSERQRRRLTHAMWTRAERDLVRIQRKACLHMGRTPLPGECDDYWAILL